MRFKLQIEETKTKTMISNVKIILIKRVNFKYASKKNYIYSRIRVFH